MSRAREKRPLPARPAASVSDGRRIACVVSRYHEELTGALQASALATLAEAGWSAERVLVVAAPGAFELPLIAQSLAARADVLAVLCFGLVLKGETEHDLYISEACAQGLMRVALDARKPVLFGVLTCATLAQAERRARRESEGGLDKGREVARAALEALAALATVAAEPHR
ncbi:MAG: 6,7-dimethyl-8-ribityllumazine synthase [Planctomycetes bacterium]|nr:6,7-dimethyl-8-ribityllumazine synthase [Planctomycetota bacterium]